MCTNKKCDLRKICYRFMAEPNKYRQSYCDFKPICVQNKAVSCDNFMELRDKQ